MIRRVLAFCLLATPASAQDVTAAHDACQRHLRAPIVTRTEVPVLKGKTGAPYTYQAADPTAAPVYDAGWEKCVGIEAQWAASPEKRRIDAAQAADAAKRQATEAAAKP